MPMWAIKPVFLCEDRLSEEVAFLHLSMAGLGHLTRLGDLTAMATETLAAEIGAEVATKQLQQAEATALRAQKEMAAGFPLLHQHSAVALWTALEALAPDLATAWLANEPSAWDRNPISKLKVVLSDVHRSTETERVEMAVRELTRHLSADLKTGVGRIEPVLAVFGIAPPVGGNVRKALHELCQVRNVIVHRNGVVDRRLLDHCPWVQWAKDDNVGISHQLLMWYYAGAKRYADRVGNQVFIAFGGEGCRCPGADEIGERPT